MDRTGKVVIEPRFDNERDFFHGLAAVLVGNKWGYVDDRGTLVIGAQFDEVRDFLDDLAPVRVSRKWGYIDTSGRMAIQPRFQSAGEFHEGLARVHVWNKVVCTDGEYTSETAPEWAFHLLENDQSDLPGCFPKGGHFGYIDKLGRLVIAPSFFAAQDFSEGLAAVRVEETADSKFGYIDRTGNMVIAPQFHQAGPFSEGLAAVETNARIVGNQVTDIAWGFIDKAGVLKIPDKYDFAAKFSEGLARVAIRMGVSEGYVDHDGKIVIAPQFTSASDFSDGLAVVWSDESEYIDRSGAAVLSGVSAQWPFSDGLAVLGLNDHRVYIDKRGQKIAPYDIGLWPDSTIRGRVFDPGHKPVAGLPVQMMAFSDESRLYPTTAVTDVDGLFAFTEVPKGEYLVGINLNGLNSKLPYEPRFYPSATKREVAKPVHVDGSVTVQGVDFQIGNRLPTRRILVSAIWPDGAPVINASVNCESPRSDDRRYGADWINRYTDSKGEATCEVLTDRDFEVLVDHLFWSRSSRPVQPISTRPRILVRAGDETVHVTIPVDRVNDISDTERPTDMSPFNQNPPE